MRSPGRISQILALAAATLVLVTPSQAYYHYVHFLTSKAPYVPVPEAFDLSALPNQSLTFFVSSTGLVNYGPNDSFGSVLSQVKQAAAAWNSVASSDLRVVFGGLETYSRNPGSVTPRGDVVFSDLPPGLLGLGAPTVSTNPVAQTGANGQFIPVISGLVVLTNTTDPKAPYGPGPSYLEEFYTTAVHEFGHALGLQHTWTASAMSQDVIRNTSRARPLDADDISALSELYGHTNWMANYGSISGRVTANGQPWNMASVVAIPPVGPAVSALTNPDGSYTINGLAPGQYMLYAHPLPQDAVLANETGLALPKDAGGNPLPPSRGYFQTEFYPNTTNLAQATTFTVAAGQALTGEDFAVQPRASVPIFDVVTYTYLDPVSRTYTYNTKQPVSIWMTPAYAGADQNYLRIYAAANSLVTTPTPVSAALLGPGAAPAVIQMFSGYIVMDFLNQGGLTAGPRHLVLTFGTGGGTDLFVLPDAVTIVKNGPPAISSLTPNLDGSVTVAGAGLTADSRVFFDGLQAAMIAPFAATDANNGAITVTPPQGASGQNATVTVFTADNQNSMFLQAASPVTYSYPAANAPQILAISPATLPAGYTSAGTAAMVDITTSNTNFVEGHVTLGFGTSDVSVRRIWVLSPTHLVANVVVANNAAAGNTAVSVISGFQVISAAGAFQIQPPNFNLPAMALPVFNAVNYATVLHANDYGTVFGANLAQTPTSAQVILSGTAVPVVYASANQINFIVPVGSPAGVATLVVNNGGASTYPVLVQIDSQPAVINVAPPDANAATGLPGAAAAAIQVTNPGDIVNLQVSNIDPGVVNAPGRVQVTISGVPMTVLGITPVAGTPGVLQVQFAVTQSFGGQQVPLVVTVDGSPSLSVPVIAR